MTGGGVGRSVAVHFAREGAHVAIAYLSEDADAQETRRRVEDEGVPFLAIRTGLASAANCHRAVERVVAKWGALDILVNNHAAVSREGR
ncbi:MAG: SDR family oxidoreductase [Archangium sp.]|nr:SDR family oxidoreductase [Archangium sp.]